MGSALRKVSGLRISSRCPTWCALCIAEVENLHRAQPRGPTLRRLARRVRLKKGEHQRLDEVLSGGVQPVRTVLRALALNHLHEGKSTGEVAAIVRLTPKAVRQIGGR